MTKDKPKCPELFRSSGQEEYAAAYIMQYVVDNVFLAAQAEGASVTQVREASELPEGSNKKIPKDELCFTQLVGYDETTQEIPHSKYSIEGEGDWGNWKIVVCSEGFQTKERCFFGEIEGDLDGIRKFLEYKMRVI
ncbi:MAG: hypothetical protein O7D31_01855 [Alphaproteobacteria bacterium]|nr:hypothetical protein [Alphaproteobacteria bacterium]